MLINEIISPTQSVLYHGSYQNNIVPILTSEKLFAGKLPTHKALSKHQGISFSRNYSVAARWGGVQGIVLALDRDALRTNHKIIPANKLHTSGAPNTGVSAKHEELAEEFLVGDLIGIKRYLVAIYLGKFQLNNLSPELLEAYSPWLRVRSKPHAVSYFSSI